MGADQRGSFVTSSGGAERSCLPDLPPSAPTLVLVGSADPTLVKQLDELSTAAASTLDIRTGVLWTQVPDGRGFLDHLLDHITTKRRDVRFAFAAPDATVDHLVRRSLLAPDLEGLANAAERADLSANPPTYEVRYQPVVNLADRSVIGFESLIRAQANGETVSATDLIDRADRGDWLNELDQLGRTMALRGVGPWLGAGLLFLNVMAPDGSFDLNATRATVEHALEIGIDADQLVFEAMERNHYVDLDHAAEQIDELRSLGVRIAVDDVGDGFASLRVVSAFKPDVVKIAGDLVKGLPTIEAESVITAIVQMAHQAGAWVVAENIETSDQAEHLIGLGVDWGQGHFLGAPASQAVENAPEASPRPLANRA